MRVAPASLARTWPHKRVRPAPVCGTMTSRTHVHALPYMCHLRVFCTDESHAGGKAGVMGVAGACCFQDTG